MGRKIPGKKHRGVKDPEKQRAKRLAELETKINAPPKNIDEQAVPKSLENIIKLKQAVKAGKVGKVTKKKKKKHGLIHVGTNYVKPSHPNAKPDKVVPILKQKPGESDNHFLYRVSKETQAFLKETEFEKKYNVQISRNPVTGDVEGLSKCPKDELEELQRLKAKHKNIKKKKKVKEDDTVKLTKQQKKKLKLKMRKEKKEIDEMDDFKHIKDSVAFGEVVHAPPQLTVRPKNVQATDSIRPGKKNLLLHSMLNGNQQSNNTEKTLIDKSGKRKNLPIGERRRLEQQQHDIIAAYRRLKAQRSSNVDM